MCIKCSRLYKVTIKPISCGGNCCIAQLPYVKRGKEHETKRMHDVL